MDASPRIWPKTERPLLTPSMMRGVEQMSKTGRVMR